MIYILIISITTALDIICTEHTVCAKNKTQISKTFHQAYQDTHPDMKTSCARPTLSQAERKLLGNNYMYEAFGYTPAPRAPVENVTPKNESPIKKEQRFFAQRLAHILQITRIQYHRQ